MRTATAPSGSSLDNATVLLVDDEPSVVSGLYRLLYGRCVVHTSTDPKEALEIAAGLPELAVVVSDMRMPGMDGVAFLSEMRRSHPDVVRVLLTGYADMDASVGAINDGRVYRFLWKPCTGDDLFSCLEDAVAQHRLITAERELLEQTLRGSVRALLETLSLANPMAFSRAERIKTRVGEVLVQLGIEDAWEIEIAAMLSQLGAVTLPPAVNEGLHNGDALSTPVQALAARVPAISVDLLAGIPRLEEVRRSILLQQQRFDGRGPVREGVAGEEIPFAARILHVVTDFDTLSARGVQTREAIAELRAQKGMYDPAVLDALETTVSRDDNAQAIRQVSLAKLAAGMVLASDVKTEDGVLLCGRGQEVTDRLLERVHNWARQQKVVEPINVLHGSGGDDA